MLFERKKRERPEVQIVSMVDVMLSLVIFFMIFANFRTAPAGITIDVPQAHTQESYETEYLVVSIDRDSQIYLERQPVSLLQLQTLVYERLKDNPNLPIVIEADRLVHWQRVIDVVDELCAVGGHIFSFAVAPKE